MNNTKENRTIEIMKIIEIIGIENKHIMTWTEGRVSNPTKKINLRNL